MLKGWKVLNWTELESSLVQIPKWLDLNVQMQLKIFPIIPNIWRKFYMKTIVSSIYNLSEMFVILGQSFPLGSLDVLYGHPKQLNKTCPCSNIELGQTWPPSKSNYLEVIKVMRASLIYGDLSLKRMWCD